MQKPDNDLAELRAPVRRKKAAAPKAGKPWWKSKTIWFNALATAAGVAEVMAQNLPILQAVLPPGVGAGLAVGVPVANVILRTITTQAINRGGSEPTAPATPE